MIAKKKTIGAAPLTDRELLDEINRKIDLVIDYFNITGKGRMTPRELEDWAKAALQQYRDRQVKKKSKERGGNKSHGAKKRKERLLQADITKKNEAGES